MNLLELLAGACKAIEANDAAELARIAAVFHLATGLHLTVTPSAGGAGVSLVGK